MAYVGGPPVVLQLLAAAAIAVHQPVMATGGPPDIADWVHFSYT